MTVFTNNGTAANPAITNTNDTNTGVFYPAADTIALSANGVEAARITSQGIVDYYKKSNILGTVSQSGGVPTGAVIESGSNANGGYVRFASGLQITTTSLIPNPINISLAAGASYIIGPDPPQPAGFTQLWAVYADFSPSTGLWDSSNGVGREAIITWTGGITQVWACRNLSSASADRIVSVMRTSIGRWF